MIYILQKNEIDRTANWTFANIYGKNGKVYKAAAWRSDNDTKKNTWNDFTKSLWYDTLITYEKVTKVSYYNSHTYHSCQVTELLIAPEKARWWPNS